MMTKESLHCTYFSAFYDCVDLVTCVEDSTGKNGCASYLMGYRDNSKNISTYIKGVCETDKYDQYSYDEYDADSNGEILLSKNAGQRFYDMYNKEDNATLVDEFRSLIHDSCSNSFSCTDPNAVNSICINVPTTLLPDLTLTPLPSTTQSTTTESITTQPTTLSTELSTETTTTEKVIETESTATLSTQSSLKDEFTTDNSEKVNDTITLLDVENDNTTYLTSTESEMFTQTQQNVKTIEMFTEMNTNTTEKLETTHTYTTTDKSTSQTDASSLIPILFPTAESNIAHDHNVSYAACDGTFENLQLKVNYDLSPSSNISAGQQIAEGLQNGNLIIQLNGLTPSQFNELRGNYSFGLNCRFSEQITINNYNADHSIICQTVINGAALTMTQMSTVIPLLAISMFPIIGDEVVNKTLDWTVYGLINACDLVSNLYCEAKNVVQSKLLSETSVKSDAVKSENADVKNNDNSDSFVSRALQKVSNAFSSLISLFSQ